MVNCIQYFSFLEKAIVNVLLKKRRSVILTTDNPALLSRAKVNILYSLFDPKISIFVFVFQYIISLENGKIKNQGSYGDIIEDFSQISHGR